MAAKQASIIESFSQCPICLDECEDPRVLPCLHTLCRECLREHVKTSARGSCFDCPSCRHQCSIPAGGVTTFPKNFFLNSLREALEQLHGRHATDVAQPSSTHVRLQGRTCSNSTKGTVPHSEATVFCTECAKLYCSMCESSHMLFDEFRHHLLQPVSEVDASMVLAAEEKKKRQKCDQHPNHSMDIYCDTCHIPVCASCCHLTHHQHSYRDLGIVGKESKSKLESLTHEAGKLVHHLDKHMDGLGVSQKATDENGTEACQQVRKTADELRAVITNQEQSLIKEIQSSQNAALAEIRAAHKETEMTKVHVESLLQYMQTLHVTGDTIDQVVHTPGLEEQLRQQGAVIQSTVTWTVDVKRETQNMTSILGTVQEDKSVAMTPSITDDMKVTLGQPVLSLKPKLGKTLFGLVDSFLAGLVVIGDWVCMACWEEPHIKMYNTKTNKEAEHTLPGLSAVGMTVVPKSNSATLVITGGNKKLHFVSVNPEDMNIIDHTVIELSFVPRNVNVDSVSGKLIVTDSTNKAIVVCDNTGNEENRMAVDKGLDKNGRMKCSLATDDGYIILCCAERGRVHWVNKEGNVIHTYGQGDGEGLYNPWHMVQDGQGRLVVADNDNHRLHLIDVNRQLSHFLLTETDDIKRPHCLWMDESTGRLFVGHRETVSAYKWPFTTSGTVHKCHELHVELNSYK